MINLKFDFSLYLHLIFAAGYGIVMLSELEIHSLVTFLHTYFVFA